MVYIFLLMYIALFGIVEMLQRLVFHKQQWSRKATHIGAGFILFFMPDYLTALEIILLSAVFTIVMFITRYKKLMSLHEVKRQTIGEILYPLSIGLIAIIYLPEKKFAFQAACLTLAFSDGLAGIIGEFFPLKTFSILKNKKSLGGSLTFALTTGVIVFTFPYPEFNNPEIKFAFIAVLTLSEFLLIYGVDNLVIPVLTAFFYSNLFS